MIKKNKIIIITIVFIIICMIGFLMYKKNENLKIIVKTERIKIGTLNQKIILEGIVVPEKQTSIFAAVPIGVDKVLVTPGMIVKVATPIFNVTGETRVEMEKQLENMKVEVNTSEAMILTLAREEKNLGYELKLLQQQVKVNKELLSQDAISSIEVFKSQTMVNRVESNYSDIKSKKKIEKQKFKILLEKQKELKNKLTIVGNTFIAPIDGIITEIAVKDGNMINKGAKLFTISEEGNYRIKIEAPLHMVNILKVGDIAIVKDISNENSKEYEGEIRGVSSVARLDEKQERIIDVDVKLKNGMGLNPGFLTQVELKVGGSASAKLVDSFSVVEENREYFVFVVINNIAEKIPVKIGMKTISKYEILNLEVGTEIIVNPFKVKQGQKLKVKNDGRDIFSN
ncbi:MAG: efflux RND transporter periplasmic adaptor subunit [Fusobacteriaceae bacterium]